MQDNIDSFSLNIMSIINGLWPLSDKSIGEHGLYNTITFKYMPDDSGQEKSIILFFEKKMSSMSVYQSFSMVSAIKIMKSEDI